MLDADVRAAIIGENDPGRLRLALLAALDRLTAEVEFDRDTPGRRPAPSVMVLTYVRDAVAEALTPPPPAIGTTVTIDGRITSESAREIHRALRRLNRESGGGLGMTA